MEFAYGQDAFHSFAYYSPAAALPSAPLLVFVHGGAWRAEDKADHAQLARTLAQLTACPVAVPNYRLTTSENALKHPAHASDVLQFLHFLCTWPGPSNPADTPLPPPPTLVLLGHSCSAHILASLLLASPFPELAPEPQLLAATRAVVFSEGIYDIDALLRSFPAYRQWFIANTFGDRDAYPDVNVSSYALRPGAAHIRWLVLHSTGDVLVDQLQSEIMHACLSALVDATGDPGAPSESQRVHKSFDELHDGHNELLRGDVYPRIIARFVDALEEC